jgi:hypothetical protein
MVRIPFPQGPAEPAAYLRGMDVRGDQAVIAGSYCGACRPVVALVDLGSG